MSPRILQETSHAEHYPGTRMWVPAFVLSIALLLWSGVAFANDYGPAQKSANEFFKNRTWVAKIPLETNGRYFIDPTGQPIEEKKQGRRRQLGMGQREIAFPVGFEGRGTYIRVDGSDREVVVILAKKRGITTYQARMKIVYSRDISKADLDPTAIARALAPYVEYEGINPDQEFAEAVNQIDVAPPRSATLDPALPMLSALDVEATPGQVTVGDTVFLVLAFTVTPVEASAVEVSEQRTLSFGGTVLPSFPVNHSEARTSGTHTSRYRQPIPSGAPAGTYTFKGEVCAGSDCVSRLVTFEVVADGVGD